MQNTIEGHVPTLVRWLGITGYESTWRAMQAFTDARDADTADEIWLTEHPPIIHLNAMKSMIDDESWARS